MAQVTLPANGWVPRHYQLPFWQYMERKQRSSLPGTYGARAVLAWHRRAGKDLTCTHWCATSSVQRVGLYWYVFPFLNQGRRILWTGMDGSGNPFLSAWPDDLVARKIDGEMRLHLKNGSIIQVMGADDPNKAVGANPIGIIFSEYSLCDPFIWQLTGPILAENGGWAIFNGTPRGENHFYDILMDAKADQEWFASHLSAKDTRAITVDSLRRARKELKGDEATFQQEYMTSFSSPIKGAYYEQQMRWLAKHGHITKVAMEPKLEVHTAWDLGLDDATSIWFYQVYGGEVRLIDYYETSGESLLSCIRYVKQWMIDNSAMPGLNYGPHDIAVKEYTTGKARIEAAREVGFKFIPVQKHAREDGIDHTRSFLPKCWFDKERCHRGINSLKCYTKEWDQARQVFKPTPNHDWASHAADAFRYLAWGFRDERKRNRQLEEQRTYDVEYEIFA